MAEGTATLPAFTAPTHQGRHVTNKQLITAMHVSLTVQAARGDITPEYWAQETERLASVLAALES